MTKNEQIATLNQGISFTLGVIVFTVLVIIGEKL